MRNKRWIAALLAIWLGTYTGPLSEAKPPDLPASNEVRCEEYEPGSLRVDGNGNGVGNGAAPVGETEAPVCIDVWCAQAMPLIAHRICQRIFAIMQAGPADADESRTQPVHVRPAHAAAPDGVVRGAVDPMFAASAEKARQLYELASRCAREGKLAEARAHLREAHLANPTCRFGRLAIERLQELEAPPPGEEQQSDDDETTQADRAFQRMRATTQPLGLVQPRTY